MKPLNVGACKRQGRRLGICQRGVGVRRGEHVHPQIHSFVSAISHFSSGVQRQDIFVLQFADQSLKERVMPGVGSGPRASVASIDNGERYEIRRVELERRFNSISGTRVEENAALNRCEGRLDLFGSKFADSGELFERCRAEGTPTVQVSYEATTTDESNDAVKSITSSFVWTLAPGSRRFASSWSLVFALVIPCPLHSPRTPRAAVIKCSGPPQPPQQ
jgi:hypothetical protein